MKIEHTVIPHEGNIIGFKVHQDKSYFLLEYGSVQILSCFLNAPSWYIKLPIIVDIMQCHDNAIFLAGLQYKTAQRIQHRHMLLALSHDGKLLWQYKGNLGKEQIWAIVPNPKGGVFALLVQPKQDQHIFRFLSFSTEGDILWEQQFSNIVLQPHYCGPDKIPPKLWLTDDLLLCVGAFCRPTSASAISILSLDQDSGSEVHFYNSPRTNAQYTQSILSSKQLLAIAWQPYGQKNPNTGISLFNAKQECVGEYQSYLHCWNAMRWMGKSLLIAGKSRSQKQHPSIERIGSNKYYQEFKAHNLHGFTHVSSTHCCYLHQGERKRQLILRDLNTFQATILEEGDQVGHPFLSEGPYFQAFAYSKNEEQTVLVRIYPH